MHAEWVVNLARLGCQDDETGLRMGPLVVIEVRLPSFQESWRPAPPETSAHLLWPCPRRCASWSPLRSAPSATAREGTGLTCALGRWSGPCTPVRGGVRGRVFRDASLRGATGLLQGWITVSGQLLLPDYPGKSERERKHEWHQAEPSPRPRHNSSPDVAGVVPG